MQQPDGTGAWHPSDTALLWLRTAYARRVLRNTGAVVLDVTPNPNDTVRP